MAGIAVHVYPYCEEARESRQVSFDGLTLSLDDGVNAANSSAVNYSAQGDRTSQTTRMTLDK